MTTDSTSSNNTSTEALPSGALGNSLDVARNITELFNRCMEDNIREGVCYVDSRLKITYWNRSAENITGLRKKQILDQQWSPNLIELRDRYGTPIGRGQCPVEVAIKNAEPSLIAATLAGRGGRKIAVDLHAIPVIDHEGQLFGAVVFFHDISTQLDLEQQVLTLFAYATRDQLTGVANRAHFERTLTARLAEVKENKLACSLIVTDIDFFKTINDDFGHHIGDQALMAFAKLIQQNTRVDDVVARFGGEEFMILCPEQDLEQAAARAEEIRSIVENTPLAVLNGKCLTASFGVSQISPYDSETTAFVKADEALLKAKESGRNRVIKNSSGLNTSSLHECLTTADQEAQEPNWQFIKGQLLICEDFSTTSSLAMVIEKIKGFVVDYKCVVINSSDDHIQLRLDRLPDEKARRWGDRSTPFLIDIELRSAAKLNQGTGTLLRVTIRPNRVRDRRRNDLESRAEKVMRELRSFLMVSRKTDAKETIRPSKPNSRYGQL
ncbi:MAG TPA: diguanylate cyclase [Pirellulaceae bacterium]|nr:diguanylate cyclase [Pirellulaceae bacterium]HMO90695.1 diguanylate cyclase [Pirellulaceae bacterium]HMP67726.1 diguanylate cyclase [Pirellulaceae bacterium]